MEYATDLLALVARIKAMPPDLDMIIPARGNLADVLISLEAQEYESDLEVEHAALRTTDAELRAINQGSCVFLMYGVSYVMLQ